MDDNKRIMTDQEKIGYLVEQHNMLRWALLGLFLTTDGCNCAYMLDDDCPRCEANRALNDSCQII